MRGTMTIRLGLFFLLAAVVVPFGVLPGRALAQQEQWLGYRSASAAREYVGSTSGQVLIARNNPPDGVGLPKFTGEKALFALWKIDIVKLTGPAARDKGLWLALDSSRKAGQYDTLYIDANGNGSLADEKPIRAEHVGGEWQNVKETIFYANFGPVRLALDGGDGTITYHAGFHYQRDGSGPHKIYVSGNCWYEGVVTIAGRKFMCSVIDSNANWRFGERSANKDQCDRYMLQPFLAGMGPQELADVSSVPMGRYVLVEGKYYTMDVAPDGTAVTFTPAKVSAGRIMPGQGVSSLKVTGPAGTFDLDVRNGFVEVPEGEYTLEVYKVARKDEKGNNWCANGCADPGAKPIVVRPGSETKLDVGEPFVWSMSASPAGQGLYALSQALRTKRGASVVLICNGQLLPAKVRITNADGTYDRTFSMEYG